MIHVILNVKYTVKVHNPSSFLSPINNWNFCLAKAKGDYIKMLFADDYLYPDCISKMVSLAESGQNIGFVYSLRDIINSGGNEDFFKKFKSTNESAYRGWSKKPGIIQAGSIYLRDSNLFRGVLNKFGEPSNILYSAKALSKVGGFDPGFQYLLADLNLSFKLLAYYNTGFIEEPLSVYRIHGDQLTSVNASEKDRLELFNLFKSILFTKKIFSSLTLRNKLIVLKRIIRMFLKIKP